MIEKIIATFVLFFSGNSLTPTINQNTFAFQDLTIPYLAQLKYESKLNKLDKLSESSNYNSYLTSYISDNLKINGLLTIPKGEEPDGGFPAIVFVHGYIPPVTYKTTEKYIQYIDYLAKNGFVVFKIDLRGHGDSEGVAGGAYYSSDYVVDTLNAYSALQHFEKVNKSKVGLWGHSMAGNVVFRSMVIKKDIPAIVVWSGAGFTYDDFLKYGIGDRSYKPPPNDSERARRRKQLMEYYGEFSVDSWFWKQVTPVNYLGDVLTKIELHHAVDDGVVDIEYSRNLDKVLDSADIDHKLFEYPSGGHNLTSPAFNSAMQRTVDFYKMSLRSGTI